MEYIILVLIIIAIGLFLYNDYKRDLVRFSIEDSQPDSFVPETTPEPPVEKEAAPVNEPASALSESSITPVKKVRKVIVKKVATKKKKS